MKGKLSVKEGSQETLPGVASSTEAEAKQPDEAATVQKVVKSDRTWGEVRIFQKNTNGGDSWCDVGETFPGGAQDAEKFLQREIQDENGRFAGGGTFVIVRRVRTVEARVQTIRRVEFLDIDEADTVEGGGDDGDAEEGGEARANA